MSSSTSSVLTRALRMNNRQRRTFIASLFGFTFLASVATVSASAFLPCPVPRGRYADAHEIGSAAGRAPAVVEKKPRRWIEETRPSAPRAPRVTQEEPNSSSHVQS